MAAAPAAERGQVSERPLKIALSICFTVGIASTFIMPVIAGSLVTGFGFKAADIGYVISAELGATAISSLAIAPWLPRLNSRALVFAALLVMTAANLACGWIHGAGALIAFRAVAGIAEGAVQAVVIGLAARTARPHRTFTWIYTTMAALSMGLFLVMPAVQQSWGQRAPFLLMAAAACLAAPVLPALPSRSNPATGVLARAGAKKGSYWKLGGFFMLIGWSLFQLGQNGMWSYAALIAERIHIDFRDLNFVFAASAISTILATLAAGWCDRRFGLIGPISLACLVSAAAIFAYPMAGGLTVFAVVTIVFSDALFFAAPFVGSLAASSDADGRLAGMLPAFQAAGMTAGPSMAGLVLNTSQSYFWVGTANAVVTLAALALMAPLAWSVDRGSRAALLAIDSTRQSAG